MHFDVDPSELNKNKVAHISVRSDVRYALSELNKIVEAPEGYQRLGKALQRAQGKVSV